MFPAFFLQLYEITNLLNYEFHTSIIINGTSCSNIS